MPTDLQADPFVILTDLIVVFIAAIVVLLVCARVKVPSVVGLLVTGIAVGPGGFGLVGETAVVEVLAEIGVVLLLFTIGVEFSIARLLRVRDAVLIGGSLQCGFTVLLGFVVAWLLGVEPAVALFIGFMLALSSTAITMRTIQERNEMAAPYGRTTLAIAIFQDLLIVPLLLLTPLLAGEEPNILGSLGLVALKCVLIIGLAVWLARKVMPWLLYQIVRTRRRELFLLTIVVISLALPWGTFQLGLSLGLGAFLAGLIISETEYTHDALSGILPFKEVFTSLFFISVGMLLEVGAIATQPVAIPLLTVGVLLGKALIVVGAVVALGLPLRVAVMTGLALSQMGEFSFILAEVGRDHGLLDAAGFQLFIAATILTMAATPYLIQWAPAVASWATRWPMPRPIKNGYRSPRARPEPEESPPDVIIVGYGASGRDLAEAASSAELSYRVIELNADTVRREREQGTPIAYGDATQPEVLREAGIESARMLAVTLPDPEETRRITELGRRLNADAYIISRTRFASELGPLYALGANRVIADEFEASMALTLQALCRLGQPRDLAEAIVGRLRSERAERQQEPPGCEIRPG